MTKTKAATKKPKSRKGYVLMSMSSILEIPCSYPTDPLKYVSVIIINGNNFKNF